MRTLLPPSLRALVLAALAATPAFAATWPTDLNSFTLGAANTNLNATPTNLKTGYLGVYFAALNNGATAWNVYGFNTAFTGDAWIKLDANTTKSGTGIVTLYGGANGQTLTGDVNILADGYNKGQLNIYASGTGTHTVTGDVNVDILNGSTVAAIIGGYVATSTIGGSVNINVADSTTGAITGAQGKVGGDLNVNIANSTLTAGVTMVGASTAVTGNATLTLDATNATTLTLWAAGASVAGNYNVNLLNGSSLTALAAASIAGGNKVQINVSGGASSISGTTGTLQNLLGLNIAAGASLSLNNTGTTSASLGAVTGAGVLNISNSHASQITTLGGDFSGFTGTINQVAGLLTISGSLAGSSANINGGAGALVISSSLTSYTGTITAGTGNLTLSGSLAGYTGSITKTSGVLTIANATGYAGDISMTNGTLTVTTLGNYSGDITLANSVGTISASQTPSLSGSTITLDNTSSLSITRAYSTNTNVEIASDFAGTGIITANAGGALGAITFSGDLSAFTGTFVHAGNDAAVRFTGEMSTSFSLTRSGTATVAANRNTFFSFISELQDGTVINIINSATTAGAINYVSAFMNGQKSNVTFTGDTNALWIFGGAYGEASARDCYVALTSGSAARVFGAGSASYYSLDPALSVIQMNGTQVNITGTASVTGAVYGGANVMNSAYTIHGGTNVLIDTSGAVSVVFGGSASYSGVTATIAIYGGTNINIVSGTVGLVVGGHQHSGAANLWIFGDTNIDVSGGNVALIFGGGRSGSAYATAEGVESYGSNVYGNVNIDVTGGFVGAIYGGGNSGYKWDTPEYSGFLSVSSGYTVVGADENGYGGNVNIAVSNATVDEIYGGGMATGNRAANSASLYRYDSTAIVEGDVTIEVSDTAVAGSIFGGGFAQAKSIASGSVQDNASIATVGGDVAVTLTDTTVGGSVYAGGFRKDDGDVLASSTVEGNGVISLLGTTSIGGDVSGQGFGGATVLGDSSLLVGGDTAPDSIVTVGGSVLGFDSSVIAADAELIMNAANPETQLEFGLLTGTGTLTLQSQGQASTITLSAATDASDFTGNINVMDKVTLVLNGSLSDADDGTHATMNMYSGSSINMNDNVVYADMNIMEATDGGIVTFSNAGNYNGDISIYGTLKMLDDVGIVDGAPSDATCHVYSGGTYDLNNFTWNGQLHGILVDNGGVLKNAGRYISNTEAEGGSTLVGDMGGQTNVNSGVVTIQGDEDVRGDGVSNITSLDVAGTATAQVQAETIAIVNTANLGGIVESKAAGGETAVTVTGGTAEAMVVGVQDSKSQVSGRYKRSGIVISDLSATTQEVGTTGGMVLEASTLEVNAADATVANTLYVDKDSRVTSNDALATKLTASAGAIVYSDGTINMGDTGLLIMDGGSKLVGSGTFGNEVQIKAGATVIVGNSPGQQTYTGGADMNIISGNSTIRFYADGEGIAGAMQGWGSGTCSNIQMGAGSEVLYDGDMVMNFQIAFSTAYLMSIGEVGTQATFVLIQYEDNQVEANMNTLAAYMNDFFFQFAGFDGGTQLGTADVTGMSVQWDADKNAIVYTGNIKGLVPEPTTATLGILGLAGLLLRRRRKA